MNPYLCVPPNVSATEGPHIVRVAQGVVALVTHLLAHGQVFFGTVIRVKNWIVRWRSSASDGGGRRGVEECSNDGSELHDDDVFLVCSRSLTSQEVVM